MATSYTWVGGALGSWNDPASWTGGVGLPGADDTVFITANSGTPPTIGSSVVQGTGAADFVTMAGVVILDGAFALDEVLLQVFFRYSPLAGHLNIGTGSSLTGRTVTGLNDNSVVVDGGSLHLTESLSVGGGTFVFRNGATVDVGTLHANAGMIVLDSTSSLTVGAPGQGIAGTIVVGAEGVLNADTGVEFVMRSIINDGTILGSTWYVPTGSLIINSGVNNRLIVGGHIRADETSSAFINNGTIESGTYSEIAGVSGPGQGCSTL